MKALAILAGALVLAACGGNDPVSEGANDTAGLNAVIEAANETAQAVEEAAENGADPGEVNAPAPAPPPGDAAIIPAQYRGRWGMMPGDCTSTRGDAKGLIAIGDRTVRFYESVASLKEQRPARATSFSGLFAFTGEGQSWEKVMTFTRTGDTLERAEEEGRFTYRRC